MAKEDIKDIEKIDETAGDVKKDTTDDVKKDTAFTKVGNYIGSHIGGWVKSAMWFSLGVAAKTVFDYKFGGSMTSVSANPTSNVVDFTDKVAM